MIIPEASIFSTRKKILLSIFAGLLCLGFSGLALSVQFDEIRITMVWSVLFPIIVAMAWGSRYGLIAGVAGGAWYPFLIWANNGYANLLNFLLLQILFFFVGQLGFSLRSDKYRVVLFRSFVLIVVYSSIAGLSYFGLFNELLALNPPFWTSHTLDYMEFEILQGILIKNVLNYSFLILTAELLLHIPIIRRVLGFAVYDEQRLNQKVFLHTLAGAVIVWLAYVSLDYALLKRIHVMGLGHLILALTVFLWASVLVSRILISYIERHLRDSHILEQKEKQLRLFFDNSTEAILWAEIETGLIIRCNDAAARMLDRTKDEIIGLHQSEIHPPEKRNFYADLFSQKKYNNASSKIEAEVVNATGQIKYVVVSSSIISLGNKEIVQGVFVDISERVNAEKALSRSESRLKAIFENMAAGIGITDLDGYYIISNNWWCNKLGYTQSELRKLTNLDITHPGDKEISQKNIRRMVNGEKNYYRLEKRFVKKDGTVFWADVSVSGIYDSEGKLYQMAGVISDISEKKIAREALIYERNFSKKIIESLPGIFYLYSYPDLKLVYWNENHEKVLDFAPGEIANRYIMDWFPPEARESIQQAINTAMQSGFVNVEAPLMTKGGKSIPFLLSGVAFEAEDKKYLLGYGVDVSQGKKAEKALKASESRQKAMIANITDVIAIIDKEGLIRYKSPNVSRWFGWEAHELLGETAWKNVHPADSSRVVNMFQRIIRENSSGDSIECRYLCKDGNYKWIEAYASNCFDYPEIAGVLVNYKDISEKKKALELEQEVIVARNSAEFKQKFLANMSHEIRTPLTGVLGMAEILQKTSLDEMQKDYLDTLMQSGDNLKEIINLILDYSKIEAGQISLKESMFRLQDLTIDAQRLFSSICNKNINWKAWVDDKLPEFVIADKHRVNQIIRNLLSNAVKFTHTGQIAIRISLHDEQVGGYRQDFIEHILIKVEVSDTGQGISLDQQSQLFEPFYQADDSYRRENDGTGLGLSICKDLSVLLGGQIGVESYVGKGSDFWFTFKAKIASEDSLEAAESGETLPLHSHSPDKTLVMLVEDKDVNRKVIKLMLEAEGFIVDSAVNGEDALKLYKPGKYGMILMDIQMPVMDGVVAARKLKEMDKQLPPVIGLSANAFEGDREKYLLLGMDEYLTKPLKISDFYKTLQRIGITH